MANFYYYDWIETDINWDLLDLNWEEVGILQEITGGSGSGVAFLAPERKLKVDLKKINELPEEKRRVIIKLATKIDGKEFVEYKYKNKNIRVKAEHMNIIFDEILNKIKIDVQNIS